METKVNKYALYPPFLAKLEELIVNCDKRGAHFWLTSGYRNEDEQNALYALGRTVKNPDGVSKEKPMGNIVTNAKALQSNHNFTIAADFTFDLRPDVKGLQPSWKEEHYKILAEEARKLGLEAGADWKTFPDRPHIQLPISKNKITFDMLRDWIKVSVANLWKELDKFTW